MERHGRKLDWREVMTLHFPDDPQTAQLIDTTLQEPETFIPAAIYACELEEIKAIQQVMNELFQEARHVPYFHYYLRLLGKIQVLIAERFPDDFSIFSPRMKRHLVNQKLFFPNERSVKQGIFDVFNGRVDPQTAISAFSFKDKVAQKLATDQQQQLARKLHQVFDQYRGFFEDNSAWELPNQLVRHLAPEQALS